MAPAQMTIFWVFGSVELAAPTDVMAARIALSASDTVGLMLSI